MAHIPNSFDPAVAYKMRQDAEREKAVKKDIARINQALSSDMVTEKELLELHREIDGKYQSAISGWGLSMYNYNPNFGFDYDFIGMDALKSNLGAMKAKLEGFIMGWNVPGGKQHASKPDVNVSVNNTNIVNVSFSFEEARKKIEDMTSLSQDQTDEIINKINELEEISKEDAPRKKKWEKVKPIISFALDKGVDVAIAILSLVVQMKLGI